jgi:O-methyltransferase involved in polyketide biosynthesis
MLGAPPSVDLIDVEADLVEGDWMDRLDRAGVDWGKPTVFVAEALLLYLQSDNAREVMSMTSASTAPGSAFVYTYLGGQGASDASTFGLRESVFALGQDFASAISSPEEFLLGTGWVNSLAQTYSEFAHSVSQQWQGDEDGGVSWLCRAATA